MSDWSQYGLKVPKAALKPSAGNVAYWLKQADSAWGKLIHAMYPVCCVGNEDCKGSVEAHHLISRQIRCVRHLPENGVCLCAYHHRWSPHLSPHMGPIGFAEWLQEERPEQYEWYREHRYTWSKNYNYRDSFVRLQDLLRIFPSHPVWREGRITFE